MRRHGEGDCVLCVIGPRQLDLDIVTTAGLPYERLNVGGIHGMAPWRALPNLARFALATPRALSIVRRFRPDVVVVGGGYVCAPVAVAAWLARVPLVTLCVDAVPGWAVRLAARLSVRVTTAFPNSLSVLPRHKTRVTGYPVREEFLHADRHRARERFGIPGDEHAIVVFGGSLGARAINRAVAAALDRLLPLTHVIHVAGRAGEPVPVDDLPRELAARYHAYTYLDAAEMADALAAADLAVCRAGAGTLAELQAAGLPAALIPGEFSKQEGNARSMEAQGAAVVILDRDLSPERLASTVASLLDDPERLASMSSACRALAQRNAATVIADIVREAAGHA